MKYDIEMWDAIMASHVLRARADELRSLRPLPDDAPESHRKSRAEVLRVADQCERVALILYVKGK